MRESGVRSSCAALALKRRMRSTPSRMRAIIAFSVSASWSSSSPEPLVGIDSSRFEPEMRRAAWLMRWIGARLPRASSQPTPTVNRT